MKPVHTVAFIILLLAAASLRPAAVLAGLPDLTLTDEDIAFSDTTPEPGEPLTITATVRNDGDDYIVTPPFDRHDAAVGSGGSDYVTVYSSATFAQSFVAGSDLYLGKVSLSVNNAGTASDPMTVLILKNVGLGYGPSPTNVPENVLASRTLVSTFTSFGWQDFAFDTAPLLSAGATYWICVTNPLPAADKDNACQWWFDIATTDNRVYASYDQGVYWGVIKGGVNYTAFFRAYSSTDTVVACYEGDPDAGGVLIGSRTIHTPIPAGTARTLSFPWAATASTGICITVDRPGFIVESDENNNTGWKQLNVAAVPPAITGRVSPAENAAAVGVSAPVSIVFSEDMNPALAVQSLSVTALRDATGAVPADTIVAGTVTYAARTLTMNAAWKKGYTYQVTVSTGAQDLYGSALAASKEWTFSTIRDRGAANTVIDENSGTKVTLSADAVTDDYYLVITADPSTEPALSGKIRQATAKLERINGGFFAPLAGSVRQFSLFSPSGEPLTGSFPQAALISFTYEVDGGFVRDGEGRLVREKTLSLYWLDEDNDLWLKLPDSTVDTQARTVSARVNHFSVYALFGGSDTDLSHAYAYPVPWKPSAGKSETGTLTDGITFTGLGSEATIRLYTLSGELVRVLQYRYAGGAEQQKWDGTNERGEAVASGVYLYRIENAKEHVTGKLIIVR